LAIPIEEKEIVERCIIVAQNFDNFVCSFSTHHSTNRAELKPLMLDKCFEEIISATSNFVSGLNQMVTYGNPYWL
jgi:hypothetical protein